MDNEKIQILIDEMNENYLLTLLIKELIENGDWKL